LYLFSKVKQGDENARYVMGNYKEKKRESDTRDERESEGEEKREIGKREGVNFIIIYARVFRMNFDVKAKT